jgi:protein O-GlcNAc transferase
MTLDVGARLRLSRELHERGDLDGALGMLRQVLELAPSIPEAHANLGLLLWQSGRAETARDALERAVAILPGEPGLWAMLGKVQADLGDAHSALASLARAQFANPRDATTWAMIGAQFAEYGRWEDAERAFEHATSMDQGDAGIKVRLAHARQHSGRDDMALDTLRDGVARHPDNLNLAVDEALYLPQVYEDGADLARWRARYAAGMERLTRHTERWREHAGDVFILNHNNFLLAYHGDDDLSLQRRYSQFLANLASAARPDLCAERRPTFDGGRRLRVGFAGSVFHDCTAGRYFERWITGLDASRFECFVYHFAPLADHLTRRVAAAAGHFIALRGSDARTAQRIAADELDILVHPEVGMTPLSNLLAALRLAPVQVAGWGHPVTTGSDAMDFYLTCGMMEPEGAEAHYSERLLPLPGPGVDYPMPEPAPPLERTALGLREGQRLYVCPQSLFKVHPEMDELFVRLLAEDEQGVVLFFQAPSRKVTERLGGRLQAALAAHGIPPAGQIKFLPRMPASAFRRVLATADVVLDTVHWSGGNTSLDALAAGTPVVSWPGRFMRGRQTAAMLQMAGLPELVASNGQDYVRIALDVARDADRNAALRTLVRQGRDALFERKEPILALQDCLLRAAAGRRGG